MSAEQPPDDRITDRLTGLPVFQVARGEMATELQWVAPTSPGTVLVGIALRDFSRINAEAGSLAGNRFLAETARRLVEVAGRQPVFRDGGDEFLIAADLPDEAAIRTFVARARAEVELPFERHRVRTWAVAARASKGDDARKLATMVGRAYGQVSRGETSELVIVGPSPGPLPLA